jgi:hypothetical protein
MFCVLQRIARNSLKNEEMKQKAATNRDKKGKRPATLCTSARTTKEIHSNKATIMRTEMNKEKGKTIK